MRRTFALLIIALLAVLCLLSMVALAARERFLERGMARELPGPNPHAAVSPYGINVEMLDDRWDDAARRAALANIAGLGFQWVKQPVYWRESGAGAGEGDAGFEALLAAARGQGLSVVPLLDGDPATGFAPPADPGEFAAWAGRLAARYGDRIDYYQVWDEPNLGSHWGGEEVNPAGYAALLAAAHDAILSADPGAVIIAAALAPTVETGPENLSDVDYLDALYRLGADAFFDVAAGKPYGFDTGPEDRRVSREVLNFSRLILLREVMEQHGDVGSALWAGNLGWNALPAGWTGQPSLWGQTDEPTQVAWIRAAYRRAIAEWPWAGVLFLENYAPAASANDPRWGFALLRPDGTARHASLLPAPAEAPIPHFQVPDPASPHQVYTGGWRFHPDYGADVGQSGDRVRVTFEGTDLGLRVRRGDYRAYFYVTVDGEPANALPADDRGAYLCLTAPGRTADDVVTLTVARHLAPGRHTAELVAERGWDQWALVGFSAANLPDRRPFLRAMLFLGAGAVLLAVAAVWVGRAAGWGRWAETLRAACRRLGETGQTLLTGAMASLFALSGWLTWLHPAGSAFRRLGDEPQAALVMAAAALFYLSPWLLLSIASGLGLWLLVCWRLDLGLALIAVSAPFYVLPKPLLGYRFSMVEMVTLMAVGSWVLTAITRLRSHTQRSVPAGDRSTPAPVILSEAKNLPPGEAKNSPPSEARNYPPNGVKNLRCRLSSLDLSIGFFALVAVISLLFTERLDVATNELRVVVLEPVLFYLMLRTARLDQRARWRVIDGFVLGGLGMAVAGLVWYATGSHVITAESGLPRLRSIYGSPNNVGLYLGRVIPLLLAVVLTGTGRRRWLYGLALLPAVAAVALSFSKGALLLGLPVGIGWVLAWTATKRLGMRRAALLLGGLLLLAAFALAAGSRIPALAGRLSLGGATTDFRVSLWKSSADMISDHAWTGVGLDNFLYQYRGRYIRPEAWQEPDLSHPHNLVLDFWARLGILGLAALVWMQVAFWQSARRLSRRGAVSDSRLPPGLLVGLLGGVAATLAHGLVDQSYFLVDLAFAWMLAAGLIASASDRQPRPRY